MKLEQQFNDLRVYIRDQIKENPEWAKDGVMLNAALSVIEVSLGDLDRIATALERIADVQDGTQHKKWADDYRERTGRS